MPKTPEELLKEDFDDIVNAAFNHDGEADTLSSLAFRVRTAFFGEAIDDETGKPQGGYERSFFMREGPLPLGLFGNSFQSRVDDWMQDCFGREIAADRIERNHRFIEEALELVQANGCTKSEAMQLVEYVYNRPKGELRQEVGGVMVTLAALCMASGVRMESAGEEELERIWAFKDKIRAKQAAKPKHSPLPEAPAPKPRIPLSGHDMRNPGGSWKAALLGWALIALIGAAFLGLAIAGYNVGLALVEFFS